MEREIVEAGRPSKTDPFVSEFSAVSSFEDNRGATIERLEEPDVDTVESEEEDG